MPGLKMPSTYRTDLPLLFKEGVARNLVDVGRLSESVCGVWLSSTSTSERSRSRTKSSEGCGPYAEELAYL